ncbi:MAG: uroporphyrinogen decarboxylase family protein [Promethearchaeota archaeon]
MVLKTLAEFVRAPWFYKIGSKVASSIQKISEFKLKEELDKNKDLLKERKQRIMDAITMKKEPDRIPVSAGGLNFFSAKYAGITCADFIFDYKKMRKAYFKTHEDFDFDLTFPSFMLSLGRIFTAADVNLFKLPGRHLSINSSYQFNEIERLKTEEYEEFLNRGIDFLIDTITPRISGMFNQGKLKFTASLGRVFYEVMMFIKNASEMLVEMKARGLYNCCTGMALPPFDIMSFVFRDLTSLTKDMMKKTTRVQLLELINRMEPWLNPVMSGLPRLNEEGGIWFVSERAFSLSPRQFGQYYWPTLKKMIIRQVTDGNIPFLVWESDVTHLVHFLLELPRKIARSCCLMCDTSDIFEVNRILDGHMCIIGNVPLSTMCVGTPKDVEKYCEKMFAELKPGGGFINCSALGIPDEAKPENVHALINYTHKYGKYI